MLPAIEHAIIAGHDIMMLGERGQAKSRIIRALVDLLDEWVPTVAGSEINDDPYRPVSRHARALIAETPAHIEAIAEVLRVADSFVEVGRRIVPITPPRQIALHVTICGPPTIPP